HITDQCNRGRDQMNDVSRFRRAWLAGSTTVAAVTAMVLAGTAAPAAATGQILGADNPNAIPNSYIVVFKESAASSATALTRTLASTYDVKVEYTYSHALHGFAGTMSQNAARRLAARSEVAYVEQNGTVHVQD